MGKRDDDLVALVLRAEEHARDKKVRKVRQTWFGQCAVDLREVNDGLELVLNERNPKWNIQRLAGTPSWVMFQAAYTANGANADDLEQLIQRRYPQVNEDHIAIRTDTIEPVGD